ncbi:Erj5p [Lachancea thermotolerans CBS 6340]|uniref:KLTH0G01122p n=1 Tax=Lachancea thermotolerans (strain ATCC 56472 / CBS 6340 / NRRL Y-8284) TaxID=559295 RepID=C5DLJ1_LACTC|nr:KLTH0G01122p [Lachancea thermotolerans CBS 6340]CAR24652.1 KLTH0G01122p [Lachancea thermotolerans CBS 6340]
MLHLQWKALVLILVSLVSLSIAFTPEEVQIFQLHQEIQKYGKNVDFYKLLKLPKLKESTSQEIRKNFRQLSKKYHPDKNQKYRKLYERLNLATKILSNDSQRKTYDYYLKNGFPKYDFNKGGFFFSRVRPSTWFTLAFIYIACGLIHYVLLRLQNDGNKARIERFLREVKAQDDTNGLGEKQLLLRQSENDEGKKIIVRLGDVFVLQPDGTEALVSTKEIKNPGISESILVSLPFWLWSKSVGKLTGGFTGPKDSSNPSTSRAFSNKRATRNKGPGATMDLPNGKVLHSRKKAQ